jgi:hypothetical protein
MKRKANWIIHILRKNFLLKRVIEGKVEGRKKKKMAGRRGRRHKQLPNYLKGMTAGN